MDVEHRGASGDLLHRVVREGWAELRAALQASDRYLPGYVVREVERYLWCGDPRLGFAWLSCDDCDQHRLVPFSCKGRGFCPSCCGRRMAERAARWVDGLLPHVPVRQWVLTVPWPRRWLLARRPELVRGVLSVLMREVTRWYQERTGVRGQTGSVTVTQRFGSAMNLNLHYHCLVLDGVYAREDDGALRFHASRPPSTEDVEVLVQRVSTAAERWLASRGFGPEDLDEVGLAEDPDDAQTVLQALSVEGRVATGRRAGGRVRRVQMLGGRPFTLPPRCASCDGYNLHAGVAVGADDRNALERLCRYVNRPPLPKLRLEEGPGDTVVLRLRRPWSDGTTALTFSKAELVEKLCAQVPPPFANTVFYRGVLAARHAWRAEVLPDPDEAERRRAAEEARREARKLVRQERRSRRSRWRTWDDLLQRVFAVNGWACPCCGRDMRLRAVVVGAPATLRVLLGLGGLSRGPPATAAAVAPPVP